MFVTIQNGFGAGELSPSVFGRSDLQKWHQGASTMRNFFVNYRGGASSRAGTAYVGMCKQGAPNAGGTATNNPPRDISFQFNLEQGYALEFGDQYMRIKSAGAYVIEAAQDVTGITNNNPGVITIANHGYSNGDWIYGADIGGMTEFNGLTWIVQNITTNTFTLTDLFGNTVNTFPFPAYTSGGTFARIYTVVSPYAAIDLPWLKYTQSADTMSLTCWNQQTLTEYPPYDLERNGATDWTFTEVTFATSISAPTNVSATAISSTTDSTYYSYEVTAVASDGEESVASNTTQVINNDISINAGSNNITWSAVSNAASYNIYSATPSYSQTISVGVLYGLIGTAFGTSFTDTDIIADFTTVPPTHQNPFARGQILNVNPLSSGASYTQASATYSISSTNGSGAIIDLVVLNGGVASYIVVNGGEDYEPTDTFTITGNGHSATASMNVGPSIGTYPGTVAYFQQRRVYANTQNNPDTYYMSQPGAFLNMDSAVPAADSDAIVGAPWAQQINGIQFMVPMPGGLVIFTGAGVWQLTGGNSAAVTPANQDATPQAYNGCHGHIQPIPINYDILFVQSKGSVVRDLQYNFFVNIYTSTDQTVLSNHLFTNHQMVQWAYAEEPYKIIWVVRDDGILLSFTYLKEQDVYAWARHDTNGFFISVVTVTEPPVNQTNVYVDAVYVIVERYVQGQWIYYSERMDNRFWENVEQSWCVDAGLSLPMTYPNATLQAAAVTGTNNISSTLVTYGGTGYTAPTAQAVDPTNLGSGATFSITIVGGVITAVTSINPGNNYSAQTYIKITDLTGSSAVIVPIITNNVSFTASSSIFSSGNIGEIIRYGGGMATIVSYQSGTQVTANITQPITDTVPNDPNNTPAPQFSGEWSLSTPVTSVSRLNNLEGLEVAILGDGSVLPNQIVTNNSIILPYAVSQLTVGLPFSAQLQTMYLEPPGERSTPQGKRKDIFGVTVRMESSRGVEVGTNQVDSSTQQNQANVPWTGLFPLKERTAQVNMGSSVPLFTGDEYIMVGADWETDGQVAFQQVNPLPANILACITWFQMGDTDG